MKYHSRAKVITNENVPKFEKNVKKCPEKSFPRKENVNVRFDFAEIIHTKLLKKREKKKHEATAAIQQNCCY